MSDFLLSGTKLQLLRVRKLKFIKFIVKKHEGLVIRNSVGIRCAWRARSKILENESPVRTTNVFEFLLYVVVLLATHNTKTKRRNGISNKSQNTKTNVSFATDSLKTNCARF